MALSLVLLMCLTFMHMLVGQVMAGFPDTSGTQVAAESNVVWTDPVWASDGTGAMPIGNGDVTSGVWVDQDTGDLRMYISKADVFDANSQPVKVGVLRLTFDPPLWKPNQPGPTCTAANFTESDSNTSVIGDQGHQFKPPSGLCHDNSSSCVEAVAKACCSDLNCVAFSINENASMTEFFSVTTPNPRKPGPGWITWTKSSDKPRVGNFTQTLSLDTGTVNIVTTDISVKVWVDLASSAQNSGVLHVSATSTSKFSLKVALEPYRVAQPTHLGRGFCDARFEQPDTIVDSTASAVTWYHWNNVNTTYYNDTIQNQGMDPEVSAQAGLQDPFTNLCWGGQISGQGLSKTSPLTMAGSGLKSAEVSVKLLTMKQVEDPQEWLKEISSNAKVSDAEITWQDLNDRSYIQLSGSNATTNATAQMINNHVVWDRYLSLVQGRVAQVPIKFNGQSFNCNNTGKGWDARDWGADYWWQNTRQPYYNTLAQGDVDTMKSFLDFYLRMLPYVEARTKAQFKGTETPITAGALYEETCTQFGTYNEGDWGCESTVPRKNGASANAYIRFHWTGALELALMVLDFFQATGDVGQFKEYLPMATGVVEAFRQRFPNKNATTGRIDMFPAQALETYQCPDPTNRDNCGTDPSTDISGLMAVLTRLSTLPASTGVSDQQKAAWASHLADLPAIPMTPASNPQYSEEKIAPMAYHPGRRGNSENTELYPAHPFRVYGIGKPGMAEAQQAYLERHSPCNDGWCQDIIQAAMLNLTAEAASQLVGRANAGGASGFRFQGFAAHYQDYEPSLDHYGFMRTGLDYMLMAPLDDENLSMVLFPTFPTDEWDVSFKLHAPMNTTIEAACVGGKLTKFVVTPPEREKDITVRNCAKL